MKVFFMSTHANQGTGYGRVANKMTNYMANMSNVEVVFYGFQNYPGQDVKDRFIDERIKFYDALELDPEAPKGFGDAGIVPSIEKEKPDILFIYSDLPVVTAILDKIPPEVRPPKIYIYLDIVYPWQSLEMYSRLRAQNVDKIFVFLECWKRHLVDDLKFEEEKVIYLPHGVDTEKFYLIDPKEAKKKMGFDEDDFIVLNMNRNSYRKMWSSTMEAFIEFLQMNDFNEKIKLYCGCMMDAKDSFNLPMLVNKICLQRGLDTEKIMSKHIFRTPTPTFSPEEVINLCYNMGDVGLNTCCGEGFGLTTLEHLYFNKPQIVSAVPALVETLQDQAIYVPPVFITTMFQFETHVGDIMFTDPRVFAQALNHVYNDKVYVENGSEYVKENFPWEKMYTILDEHIEHE